MPITTTVRKHHIDGWDPEDVDAWRNGGAKIARRNLIWSIVAEHVGFSVWSIWSVMVLFMPQNIYHIDAADKFVLVAVPTLVGAFLRVPYTFAVGKFGGRNWTVFSATVLLVPTLLTLYYIAHPGMSYTTFMIVAAIAGFGGGNFASSMTNINAFYPQRLKGWALGLNAGGGNIGVAVIQIAGLLVIAAAGNRSPHWVCAIYLVLIAIAAVGAALFMDNLTNQHTDVRSLVQVMAHRDSWLIALLYIGTFGSFIGFSFAFGQVLQINFLAELSHGGPVTAAMTANASLHAAQVAFIGPLLGSLTRPIGGRLSDRFGGGEMTLYTFAAMIAATGWLTVASELTDASHRAPTGGSMAAYIVGFVALFILSGIGNGSVYKMIPSIFDAKSRSLDHLSPAEKAVWSRRMSGALIGIAGAIGALGGVGINVVLRASYLSAAKSATMAFWVFLGFYVLCAAITWVSYVRRPTRASTPNAAGTELAPEMVCSTA
ncbi:MAG: NarK/NasA family nitrate transporter [Mycobacterium pseudokansasii]|uniref:Nitrate/nitrite transporter NarK n=2 Tax=Mycobacterium TaxID=1763 RepID=A0A498QUY4_9MYCO|nr:nitrate/nitrite transporter [Mycobacterium pseudokansasii]KZS66371.1 MFS transporter [Mycobacterium kansasii]MBY0389755.1 NarK/NasA family nitrate transporter [Mycobacterium pseudokansasii]VAZ97945.1 Nitrate/nitrite transporter NarK [Mycobacterium pseudokansasii]VAZ99483.1 Nitrate/nitrite transporter NarK [Mycobacterium pseudokansasii]VBA52899.1 Nitrate/nitrite transporter NarK [Mycobacterium pseudokansasii]